MFFVCLLKYLCRHPLVQFSAKYTTKKKNTKKFNNGNISVIPHDTEFFLMFLKFGSFIYIFVLRQFLQFSKFPNGPRMGWGGVATGGGHHLTDGV